MCRPSKTLHLCTKVDNAKKGPSRPTRLQNHGEEEEEQAAAGPDALLGVRAPRHRQAEVRSRGLQQADHLGQHPLGDGSAHRLLHRRAHAKLGRVLQVREQPHAAGQARAGGHEGDHERPAGRKEHPGGGARLHALQQQRRRPPAGGGRQGGLSRGRTRSRVGEGRSALWGWFCVGS